MAFLECVMGEEDSEDSGDSEDSEEDNEFFFISFSSSK